MNVFNLFKATLPFDANAHKSKKVSIAKHKEIIKNKNWKKETTKIFLKLH